MKRKIKNFKNKQSGITLVALVITIIILLILATISIQSLTNTGLFQKANEAKDKTKNATENQAKTLNEYEDAMNEYLSNSTAVKEQFKGKTVEEAIKYADLLSKDNNIELKDAKNNKIIIPAGFKVVSDDKTNNAKTVDKGIVIEDMTNTTTKGSQFVWVPVGTITKEDGSTITISLNRYSFDENGNSTAKNDEIIETYFQELENTDKGNIGAKNITNFKNSVATNGGYYIGRYEARTNIIRTSNNDTLTKVTEKSNDNIYTFVTQSQASELSKDMYQNENFTSDLINSYAWDTAILYIQNSTEEKSYAKQTSLNSGSIANNGTNNLNDNNKIDVKCNIYDMSSNVYEWNTETSLYENNYCVYRGGSFDFNIPYTSTRSIGNTQGYGGHVGFRPILYIK